MLPPNYLDGLESQIANLYAMLEVDIIKEISDRILAVGYANTVVHNDVIIAQQAGILYSNIIQAVAKNTNRTYSEIEKIFNDAGIKTIKNDDKIYKKAGLNPLPINMDINMLQILNASIENTSRNLNNLSGTTATTSQQGFINVMNNAFLEVSTGVKSYSQSIIDAIDNLSEQGTTVVYPSGYKASLESATRMNIITSVNQTCGKMQLQRANELGWDLMELTAHSGARPSHAEWQGKIVSLSGKEGYLSLKDIGYGKVDGFKGINCRHDWNPYYEGSSRTYSDKTLEKWRNEKVLYDGKEMSVYEASQVQRKMERQIRTDKKKIIGLQQLLTNNSNDLEINIIKDKLEQNKNNYNIHNNQLIDFTKQVNMKINNSRLYINKLVTKPAESATIEEKIRKITGRKNAKIELNYEIPKDIEKYKFDIEHINDERQHNITKEQAIEYIKNSKLKMTVWQGKYENYYSEEGATYVDSKEKKIRTAFSKEEYDEITKKIMEVLNGKA